MAGTRLLFLAAGLMSMAPLWSVKYLPMVDLPQHAAQIFLWSRYDDPALDLARTYELNYFTPYLLGYCLVRLLTSVTGLVVALKLVISAAVLGLPLAMAWLLSRAGRDPTWALAGFPLAFGYSFYWGFFNYLVALPLGLLFVGLAIGYADRPDRRGAATLAVAGCLLFFGHLLVLGLAALASGLWILLRAERWRDGLLRTLPLAAPLPMILAWGMVTRNTQPMIREPPEFGAMPWVRLADLPGTLLGESKDVEAWWCGLLLLGLVALSGRPAREAHRWGPFLAASLVYIFGPYLALGARFLYPRFALYLLPFFLLAWDPRPRVRPALLRGGLAAIALGWLTLVTLRFQGFDREAVPFDRVTAAIEPGKSLVSVAYYPVSEWVPGRVPFVHFAAWSQARRGGLLGFSFAVYFPEMVRYRDGFRPPMTPGLEVWPRRFDWKVDGAFDYYLVKTPPGMEATLFRNGPVSCVSHEAGWWLYRRSQGVR